MIAAMAPFGCSEDDTGRPGEDQDASIKQDADPSDAECNGDDHCERWELCDYACGAPRCANRPTGKGSSMDSDKFECDEIRKGSVCRVRAVSPDGFCVYVEFRSGHTAKITRNNEERWEVNEGAILFVDVEQNLVERAPKELWPEDSWVGVVRLVLDDITVVSSGVKWEIIPNSTELDYDAGNTVEVLDSRGVVRVLADKPIKYIEFPTDDEVDISRFRLTETAREKTFADFGGLESVVERARELIEVPLLHKSELTKIGARPIKGVLFTGPPGTGKTMLAKIIASNTRSEFYEISGPEVLSKWYGQSEEILRKLFEEAGRHDSAIIFFDEIDSIAVKRADETHGTSRRLVAQLLTLMDGFTKDDDIVVIATTNRPQDIDAALKRPGRFDWEIEFPLPNRSDRERILRVSERDLNTADGLPHEKIAARTNNWSGAELTAIWSEAALLAAVDGREVIVKGDYFGGFQRVLAQKENQRENFSNSTG
jgi:transitional endoplasmic reticulum ATPase